MRAPNFKKRAKQKIDIKKTDLKGEKEQGEGLVEKN